jgi:hypothetical protein
MVSCVVGGIQLYTSVHVQVVNTTFNARCSTNLSRERDEGALTFTVRDQPVHCSSTISSPLSKALANLILATSYHELEINMTARLCSASYERGAYGPEGKIRALQNSSRPLSELSRCNWPSSPKKIARRFV